MDIATIIGIVGGIGAILLGQALEGGSIMSILQPTAAFIVFGGTFGAVLVQFPLAAVLQTLKTLRTAFVPRHTNTGDMIGLLVNLAKRARRDGLVSIERDIDGIKDPFLKRALELAVDGTESKTLRSTLEIELERTEEKGEQPAKVLEAAGGYSPTIGIIGAVLGLIHVMENLSDPSKLGAGIAVAFVATVYGVGAANLLYLPLAGKLKLRHQDEMSRMEMMVEGVCALAEGEHPRLLERKLTVYADTRSAGGSAEDASAAAVAAREST